MNDTHYQVAKTFSNIAPDVDAWTLRLTSSRHESITVRQGVLQPVMNHQARGALLTVVIGDGSGYAATSDLSPGGLRQAARLGIRLSKSIFKTIRRRMPPTCES